MANFAGDRQPPWQDHNAPPPYSRAGQHSYIPDGIQRPPQPPFGASFPGDAAPPHSHLPPPPMGDALRPALKRQDSRSRLPPDTRPEFPDEASYLGGRAPDLEAKNHPEARHFRDKRDGYQSDEGETLRRSRMPGDGRRDGQPPYHGYDDRGPPPHGYPHGGGGYSPGGYPPGGAGGYPPPGPPRRDPRDEYPPRDYAPNGGPSRRRDQYDDDRRPPPRGGRESYYDDDAQSRRRRSRAEVEYGSDPVPVGRRRSERQPPSRRRRDDYDDYDDRYGARRPRSHEDYRRPPRDSHGDGGQRRRSHTHDDRRRHDRNRRRYSDDDYYSDDDDYDDRYGRRDRRSDRDRDRRRPPQGLKIGGFDIGPLMEKGQKHYSTLAPILTPLLYSAARKYLPGSGSGGSRRRSR